MFMMALNYFTVQTLENEINTKILWSNSFLASIILVEISNFCTFTLFFIYNTKVMGTNKGGYHNGR